CLKVWPGSADAHLLASRAARRADDYESAEDHLREGQRLRGGASEETAFEWALLHASGGDLPSTESFLRQRLREQPQDAALVLEALAGGYLRMYRILDALGCLDQWLRDDPNNVRALTLKGNLFWQVKAPLKAIPEYRRGLELDADQHEVRWRLARCLLYVGRSSEALTSSNRCGSAGRTTPRSWSGSPAASSSLSARRRRGNSSTRYSPRSPTTDWRCG